MKLVHYDRPEGYPVLWTRGFSAAWDECIELQCSPKAEWIGHATVGVQYFPRTDIVIFGDDGEIMGGVIVASEDSDPHVRDCLAVLFQYVLPEHRNKGVSFKIMRYLRTLARARGHKTIAYTHRTGDWRYETIYKRISNGIHT